MGLKGALNGATAATWRVFAPAGAVAREVLGAVLAIKCNGVAIGLKTGAPCGCIEFDDVAGVYTCAGPATPAGIFCCHCLNHTDTLLN